MTYEEEMLWVNRRRALSKALASVVTYSGPIEALGELPEGVDDDLFQMACAFRDRLEERLREVEKM